MTLVEGEYARMAAKTLALVGGGMLRLQRKGQGLAVVEFAAQVLHFTDMKIKPAIVQGPGGLVQFFRASR